MILLRELPLSTACEIAQSILWSSLRGHGNRIISDQASTYCTVWITEAELLLMLELP